jgi:mycoredoxin
VKATTNDTRSGEDQLTVYGSTTCEDTERSIARLNNLGVPYRFVDIDHDSDARRLIAGWNNGRAQTPTIVLGAGEQPRLIEPSDDELDQALRERGLIHTNTAYRA